MVFLSNVSFSNDIYNFQNSNGYIQLQQSPTISSTIQYTTYHQYNQSNNIKLFYGDNQSNISVTHSNFQSNSWLHISLNNSNIFSTSNIPYISYSNSSNTFQVNLTDTTINLLINNSNLLKISSLSNSIPAFYNSNADIYFYGSSNLKISNISYQPIGVISNPIIFKQPIQAPIVSSSNITQLSNVLYTTSNNFSSNISNVQTTANWSSNNLLNKITGGTINAPFTVQGTVSPGAGYYYTVKCTNPAGGYGGLVIDHTPTYGSMNLLSNSDDMLNVKLYNESKFIVKKETGWVGVNTSTPSTTLDINGTINATQYVGSTITNLSNLGLFGSNVGLYSSNSIISLSNYLFGSNTSGITNAQTTANWASNNLFNKTGGTITGYVGITSNLTVLGVINTATIQNNVGITNIKGEYDINYTADYDGNNGGATHVFNSFSNERMRITPTGNVGIGTNNPQYKLDVAGTLNASSNITSPNITSLSNLGMFSSNTAFYSSNQTISLSNFLFGSNTSNITTAQTTANWASNSAVFGSNTSASASNTSVYSSNSIVSLCNTFISYSNFDTLKYNSLSNVLYSNLQPQTIWSSNTSYYSSNLVVNTSNVLYSNLQPQITWTSNLSTTTSNYSYTNIPSLNTTLSSLSNYTYNLSTSNTTLCNFYTNNFYTKNVSADGGNIGAWIMSAAGLGVSGYTLFNNSGKLSGALTDALGKININPESGFAQFVNGLFGYSRFTDAIDIGKLTMTISNDTIYYKNSNTSNTTYTSNAITILNSNLTTFTISNANLYTNCNVYGSNISTLSNLALWSSNNLANKSGDTFTGNVGIGSTPSIPLEITKSLAITSNDTTYIPILSNLGGINNFTGMYLHSGDYGTQSLLMYSGGSYTNGRGIIQAKDTLNVRNTPNPLLLNPIGGYVGIGLCNPQFTLDVNGTINASQYIGSTITNLSNLGVFASNTAISTSNNVVSLSNQVYNSITNNITTAQTTANWASNAALFGSNTSLSASNTVISLSNYVYGTNTTNITNAQTTANWASNAGLFNSNATISLSNYVNGTITTNITNAQTTANWASNAGVFGSNLARTNSNVLYPLSNQLYTTTTNNITSAQNTANFGSNTAVSASNNVISLSNAFYTSSTNATAISASNVAYWSSNNINWNQLQNKPFQVWRSDLLGGSINSVGYYKIATLYDTGNGANGTNVQINGWCGGFGGAKMSFHCLVGTRGGVSMKAYTQGTFQTNFDIMLYQEADNTFSLYFYNGEYFTSWLFEINADTTYGATLLTPTGTKTTPTGTLNTKMTSNLVMVASGTNVGIGLSNPSYNLDVNGTTRLQGNIYKDIPAYDPSYGDYSQFTIGTYSNVAGQTWNAQMKLGVTNCNGGMAFIQSVLPFIGKQPLVFQPSGGNVGIGVSNPAYNLDVMSTININTTTNWGSGLIFMGAEERLFKDNTTGYGGLVAHINSSSNFLVVSTGGIVRMLVQGSSGNVGIGTASPSYKLHIAGETIANGWFRTTGNCGWYNETYGGGWYMTDTTWIRTFGGKNMFHDGSIMRTDGHLQVGDSGTTFSCSNGGNLSYRTNVLVATNTGNVGIGTATPSQKLEVVGNISSSSNVYATNRLGIGTTIPLYELDVRGNMQIRGTSLKYSYLSITDSNLSAEVRITAHSNQNSYIEYYGDLYFKKISLGGTVTNPTVLAISSNANLGIGTSNNLTRLAIKSATDNSYNNGAHIEVYGATDNYPIYQHLNYNHDNSAMNFDSYWNGSGWISSSSTNNFQIYKLGGSLQFNFANGVTAGSSITWSNLMTLSNNTVCTKYITNTGSISTQNLAVGGGTYMTFYRVMSGLTIGTSSTSTKTISVSFGAFGNPPNSSYTVMCDYSSPNNDVFAWKALNKTTTGFDLLTCRVDTSTGWLTAPNVTITIIGY